MAYNSDGYIMIDFADVDFRRTNQTIDGLFDRCQKVIGANKFVIVINANGKTPLPSTVSITNGQYVIESVLYTFSISAADNLHITKKTNADELIDDDHVSLKTTFSSDKIMSLLEEGHKYSTNEQIVGTWIDGSPVYEKTIVIDNISGKTYTYSLLELNISNVIDLFIYVHLGSDGGYSWMTSPHIEQAQIQYRLDSCYQSGDKSIHLISDWGLSGAIMVIRYTKSST